MQPSTDILLAACRQGDAAAWETLIARYERLVWSIPRLSKLDEDQCADVFQVVFMKLVEKLDTIEHPEFLGSWLTTTAQRETWRVARLERALPVALDEEDEDGDTLLDDDPLPDDILLRLELQHRVRSSVMLLDERCRQLLTLLFYCADPPPYAEVAAILGAREGSIGPTRARCLAKLRQLLGDDAL
jgi:RNA polymerase sigma factor (sigma-70 family)